MAGTTHEYAKLPLPPGELYEKVLESARSNEKSISEHFAKLPFSQQKIVEQTLLKIDPNSHSVSSSEPLATSVVVTLESRGPNRQNSALRKLKTLFRSDKAEVRSNCLKITLMRMLVDSEEEDPDLGEEKKEEEEEPANNRLGKHQADVRQVAARLNAISKAASAADASPSNPKKPIHLKDAVGRNFTFPFEFCCTWEVCYTPYPIPNLHSMS